MLACSFLLVAVVKVVPAPALVCVCKSPRLRVQKPASACAKARVVIHTNKTCVVLVSVRLVAP